MAYGFDPDVPGVSPSGVSSEPAFAGMSSGESYSYGSDPVSVGANGVGLSAPQ